MLRIGTRPAEKRATCRFRAHFAVESRRGDDAGTLGVTADLSEHGCGLLWPAPLEQGQPRAGQGHFGPTSRDWIGEVLSLKGRQKDGWYLHGVRCLDFAQRTST